MQSKEITFNDICALVEGSAVKYEHIVFIIALWVFNKSEQSLDGEFDNQATFNHGGSNWFPHICGILVDLEIMDQNERSYHAFSTNWRPWLPLKVSKKTKEVPTCLLIAAFVHLCDFTELEKPYFQSSEIPNILPFELNEFDSFEKGYDVLNSILPKIMSSVISRLRLSNSVKRNTCLHDITVHHENHFEGVSAFLCVGLFDWDLSVMEQCDCPCERYSHRGGCTCPAFSMKKDKLIRSIETEWMKTSKDAE